MTYKIIDNFLEHDQFEKIKTQLMSPTFPWFFLDSTVHPKDMNSSSDELTYGFTHMVVMGGKQTQSLLYNMLKTKIIDTLAKNGENVSCLERLRVNCLLNTNRKWLHAPHIDKEEKHKTAILYFHGDGNTVVFSEKYNVDSGIDSVEYFNNVLNHSASIEKECEPKDNRLFCFDGLHYHAAYNPMISSRRIVIAFNYKIHE